MKEFKVVFKDDDSKELYAQLLTMSCFMEVQEYARDKIMNSLRGEVYCDIHELN